MDGEKGTCHILSRLHDLFALRIALSRILSNSSYWSRSRVFVTADDEFSKANWSCWRHSRNHKEASWLDKIVVYQPTTRGSLRTNLCGLHKGTAERRRPNKKNNERNYFMSYLVTRCG
jgi:hypothetical protein